MSRFVYHTQNKWYCVRSLSNTMLLYGNDINIIFNELLILEYCFIWLLLVFVQHNVAIITDWDSSHRLSWSQWTSLCITWSRSVHLQDDSSEGPDTRRSVSRWLLLNIVSDGIIRKGIDLIIFCWTLSKSLHVFLILLVHSFLYSESKVYNFLSLLEQL